MDLDILGGLNGCEAPFLGTVVTLSLFKIAPLLLSVTPVVTIEFIVYEKIWEP